jgi:hypothetical protein
MDIPDVKDRRRIVFTDDSSTNHQDTILNVTCDLPAQTMCPAGFNLKMDVVNEILVYSDGCRVTG